MELTPEREYLLVTKLFAGTVELDEAEVTDQVIDDGLRLFFGTEHLVETPLRVKDVGCGELEPLWLMAQSVPSASLVPCLQLVPATGRSRTWR